MISIVITSYNRRNIVSDAIESALSGIRTTGFNEVILVDDCSTDGTLDYIRQAFSGAIADGQLKLTSTPHNLGVTGAKNTGYSLAKGPWVGFLDSDDTLLQDQVTPAAALLSSNPGIPIAFFRCQDLAGHLIGTYFSEPQWLDIARYVRNTSYGEALTFINKAVVPQPPYIDWLRGYEGLGCLRIIRDSGPALLSPICLRLYNQVLETRLSTLKGGLLKRLPLLAKGHRLVLKEFGNYLSPTRRFRLYLVATIYAFVGSIESRRFIP